MLSRLRMLAVAALLSLVALGGAPASMGQPAPAPRDDQRHVVRGWLVEDLAESDGGRVVRLSRVVGDYRIEHHVSFWRGNGSRLLGLAVGKGDAGCSGEEWREPWESEVSGPALRTRLVAQLQACGASARDIALVLEGFETAFGVASAWTSLNEAETLAEMAALAADDTSAMAAEVPPPADPTQRVETIGEWRIEEMKGTPDPAYRWHSLEMQRDTPAVLIRYDVHHGAERKISVLRHRCGTISDWAGGPLQSRTLTLTGTADADVAALRRAAAAADAQFNRHCGPRGAELEAALAGFEAAFAAIERWAAERPIPALLAWDILPRAISRWQGRLSLRYDFRAELANERLIVAVESCGAENFEEEVAMTPALDADSRRRRANEAAASLLQRAAMRCELGPNAPALLLTGFDEALAAAEVLQ